MKDQVGAYYAQCFKYYYTSQGCQVFVSRRRHCWSTAGLETTKTTASQNKPVSGIIVYFYYITFTDLKVKYDKIGLTCELKY